MPRASDSMRLGVPAAMFARRCTGAPINGTKHMAATAGRGAKGRGLVGGEYGPRSSRAVSLGRALARPWRSLVAGSVPWS